MVEIKRKKHKKSENGTKSKRMAENHESVGQTPKLGGK